MRARAKNRRGYVLVSVGLMLPLFLGFLGLAIDLGYFFYVRRQMQKATDAAAIGGDYEVQRAQYSQVTTAGQYDASLNGFTDGQNGVTITINNPPASGLYNGDTLAVEAIINQPVPSLFMKVFGIATVPIRTRAVAHLSSGANCIFALDPSMSGAITVAGTAVVVANCGVMDDSNSTSALQVGGTTGTLTATAVNVAGGWSGTGIVNPTPITGQTPLPDPLAYLTPPTYSSTCNDTNTKITGPAIVTLNPGVYCGGISITGQAVITFNPGLYVLAGGGMSIGGGAALSGTGVTLYNTGPFGSPSSCGAISISGNPVVNLTAPTSGGNYGPSDTGGILFFQDRSCSTAATATGTGIEGYSGALYFPDANLTYAGTELATTYSIVVADSLTFEGTPNFNDSYTTLPEGSPVRRVVLGE